MDIFKAFDTLNHDSLLGKLQACGLDTNTTLSYYIVISQINGKKQKLT